jgi:hypothetical protein
VLLNDAGQSRVTRGRFEPNLGSPPKRALTAAEPKDIQPDVRQLHLFVCHQGLGQTLGLEARSLHGDDPGSRREVLESKTAFRIG